MYLHSHHSSLRCECISLPPAADEEAAWHIFSRKFRQRLWDLFESPDTSMAARYVSLVSVSVVLLSITCLCLGSMRQFQNAENRKPHVVFEYIESLCVLWFTIEYGAKVIAASNRLAIMKQPLNVIDLIAILPFYFELFLGLFGFDMSDMQGGEVRLIIILCYWCIYKLYIYLQPVMIIM